jgi:iron complex outermembrane receptor protein
VIATPANENFATALRDPTLAPFVQLLSPATNAADLARVNALFADPAFVGGSTFPAQSIGAVVDTRNVNTGRVTVAGLDMTIRYSLPVGSNRFDFTAGGTWLDRWDEKVTPAAPAVDRLNQVARPIDLKGRASLGWIRGIANATIIVAHVDRYRDPTGRRIAAWNTVDAQIGVSAPADAGWLSGTSLSIAVTNLLDAAPPFYDNPGGIGYDAANADGLGRFVSLQLTRRW